MATSVLILLLLTCALAAAAGRLGLPPPVLYLAGGVAYGLGGQAAAPWLPAGAWPALPFSTDVVFAVFFPVLLYAAAVRMPWNDFRANAARSVFFGLSTVVLTTLAVGAFAALALDLPVLLACLLGVCVADPDFSFFASRATEANTSRPLRRAVASEGLVEGTAMLLLYVALSDAVGMGGFAAGPFALDFALGPAIGVVAGAVLARAAVPLFRRLRDPTLTVAFSLALPFAVYLPAQAVGGVRLAAVVAAGFVTSQRIDPVLAPRARQVARAVWDTLVFLVGGAIYLPAGAALAEMLGSGAVDWDVVAWAAPAVAGLCVLVRVAWAGGVWGACRLAGIDLGPWRDMMMGALAATRGAFALASALALPVTLADGAPLPQRDLLVALALGAAAASLAQMPLIAWLATWLPQKGDGREDSERRLAWAEVARAGLDVLDRRGGEAPAAARSLRSDLQQSLRRSSGAPGAVASPPDIPLRLAVLDAQRERLQALRDSDRISGEVFQTVEGELDYHAAYLEESRELTER